MVDDLDSETPDAATGGVNITNYVPTKRDVPDSVIRQRVSYLLLGLLAAIVVAAFVAIFTINGQPSTAPGIVDSTADAKRLMDLMNMVFGPIVTLFSSVVGFYFGARTAREARGG